MPAFRGKNIFAGRKILFFLFFERRGSDSAGAKLVVCGRSLERQNFILQREIRYYLCNINLATGKLFILLAEETNWMLSSFSKWRISVLKHYQLENLSTKVKEPNI